ncbi:MAG: c-type cytochrome [Sulfurimonas sp.]|uniref:c-type cytochrome n=1 Tax=Sulfurimonas sp. TaxID=2022749 RepID=UPI00262C5BAA|nr:c-type cytochrome [Sulfurimonas sp.]MCW8895551.1 c-type cytochrome [Sulfurimonas sp.]MCW8954713.1 c-type cytochrome [Sulfurimonas sp.]MCW9067971.1 c-type cytochrome [Sulfurimonas sp.]
MKNKEPIILAVVVFFSLATYYLVEPFAHHVLHKKVIEAKNEGFAYNDLPAITKTGNAASGKDLVVNGGCTGCHSIEVAGMPAPMDAVTAAGAYGVNPPDLSNAGAIYDAKFLADLIKNPAHALKVEHKFDAAKGEMHPMVSYYGMGGDIDQEVADMVAYMQSIAVKPEDVTPAMAYEDACGRCHSVEYEKWTQIGEKPKFKHEKDSLAFDIKVIEYQESLIKYMGKLPPDLSMYIRSRGDDFLSKLIENPQNILEGTAMPRVGVTADAAEKIIEHMKDAGDTKRHEREEIGRNVMIYIIIFAIFAFLWKKQVWRDLH